MNKKTFFALIASSLLLGGCSLAQNPIQQKVEQKAAEAAADVMLKDIEDPLIRKHLAAQFRATSYKVVSQSSGKDLGLTTMMIQANGTSAKFRTTTTDTKGKVTNDMIVDGDTTYVLDLKDNVWWKQSASKDKKDATIDFTEKFSPDEMKKQFEENKSKLTYKSLGKEACDTLTCYKYQEVNGDSKEGNRTFWFDEKDYLLRKDESKFGEFSSTNTYSYNGVEVQAPSPTKDVPEGKSAYEMMYAPSMPSVPSAKKGVGVAPGAGGADAVPSEAELKKLMEQYGGEQ